VTPAHVTAAALDSTEADRAHSIRERARQGGGFLGTQDAEVHAGPAPLPQLAATAVAADSSVKCRTCVTILTVTTETKYGGTSNIGFPPILD
jgi:hypothetical protein